MAYEDIILGKALRNLKNNKNGRMTRKDAIMIFSRKIKFDKDMGKITLKELEKRGDIKIKRRDIVIL